MASSFTDKTVTSATAASQTLIADSNAVVIGSLPVTVPNQDYAVFDANISSTVASATLVFRPIKNTTTFRIFNAASNLNSFNSSWSGATLHGCVMYPAS